MSAKKKRQHWVPKFYLRQFSADDRSIQLTVVESEYFVDEASIKLQCYEDYFYGRTPEVEDALQKIEDTAAPLIKRMSQEHWLPKPLSAEEVTIRRYMAVQKGRTLEAGRKTEAMATQTVQHLAWMDEMPKQVAEKLRVKSDHSVLVPLSASLETGKYLGDLEAVLVLNETDREFMTSDQPVVSYNIYCEVLNGSARGLASKGLFVLFPLSPNVLLMLFDKEVYRLRKAAKGCVSLRKERDLRQLNRLQWANATNVVIVGPNTSEKEARTYIKQAREDREDKAVKVQPLIGVGQEKFIALEEAQKQGIDIRKTRQMLITYETFPVVDLDLSFLEIRGSAMRGGKREPERMRELRTFWQKN